MPLLLCRNCNASMQAVNRSGVELDMCPQCRGVWLDRGELEKILDGARGAEAEQRQVHERFERDVQDFHRDPYDNEAKRYRHDDDRYRYKKKKGFDLFDIFD